MVFRVRVVERGTDLETDVYVAASSREEAMRIADRRGRFTARDAEAVPAESVPPGEPLLRDPAAPAGDRGASRGDPLRDRPILTIAAGVFVGLFAWTAFVLLLGYLLGAFARLAG